jgi:hypothetical protein
MAFSPVLSRCVGSQQRGQPVPGRPEGLLLASWPLAQRLTHQVGPRGAPLAFASSSIPPAERHPVGTSSTRPRAESHQRVPPFPLSMARTLRVTLSTGFGDGAHGSVRWLPTSSPGPCGSSVSASYAGALSRWLNRGFASATPRFLRDGVAGLRLPDTAVDPRCSPLRTSRETGGYACTSAPEG